MHVPNFKQRSVDVHDFAMVPKPGIPRSSFRMQKGLKTAFDAGYLVPVFVEEVLPGDTFNVRMTAFARLATPIFPIMDNIYLESFFFFVPNRLCWSNWKKFMGEQDNPADAINYVLPRVQSAAGGFTVGSVYDYMGLPTVGQVGGGNTVTVNCLPLRAYSLIWNAWFRAEDIQNSLSVPLTDGVDAVGTYVLKKRNKRHDYFTGCLPWTQKGGVAVTLPVSGLAPVTGIGFDQAAVMVGPITVNETNGTTPTYAAASALRTHVNPSVVMKGTGGGNAIPSIYADLNGVTQITVNQLRQSVQIQKLLERDARGGTRYTEMIRAHFGVTSPDARLQRPEYLGGGQTPISVSAVPQTSATGLTGGSTPAGTLVATGAGTAHGHGFTQSFTEHGYIIGMVNVRADLTYQQGLRKHWKRSTRYDYYFPAFATLGEQAVLNQEIYCDGSANDTNVFGYQERWAEYRYNPSEITGLMRSTSAGTIDPWHLAQKFTALPTLNTTFIEESPPLSRVLAVGSGANGQQIIMDAFFDIKAARPLPMYSVPGLIDHF